MAKSFLRIRPIVGCSSKDENSVFYKLDDTRVECRPPTSSQSFKNSKSNLKELRKKIFEFDEVLDEDANQEKLYNDCVQPLLTEFFNGENVLLFAYGTTSSGKTYTMRGDAKNAGVVPRCISDIFQSVQDKLLSLPSFKRTRFNDFEQLNKFDLKRETEIKSIIMNSVNDKTINLDDLKSRPDGFKSFLKEDTNVRHIVWVSFLELYNENLVDLLTISPNSPTNLWCASSSNERAVPLKVMRDQNQNFFVSGLRHVYVNSAEEAMKVYSFGIDNLKKHISSTAMNRTSSRSHSVFTVSVVTLKSKNENDYRVLHVNNLSLCDLAGQERGKKTQTTGIHLKEAGKINKSLFSLKRCIQVIKEKKNSSSQLVVPFTESILTKTFQPYLSGNGLTFMIININPKPEHFDETLNSLEFSATASQVVIARQDSTNSLKDKIQRLTQLWLETSKRWSTVQDFTSTNLTNAFLNSDSTTEQRQQANKSKANRDLIVDSLKILKNQKFDSTYFEESITQKVREMEETFIEYELYDSQFVDDLNNRIDELEQQIEIADRNPGPDRDVNLECIYNSIAEIHERHLSEKEKIKERMNTLMNQRMEMLSDEHRYETEELEKEIEQLNLRLLCRESELERVKNELEEYKMDAESNSEHLAKMTQDLEDQHNSIQMQKAKYDDLQKSFEHKLSELERLRMMIDHREKQYEHYERETDIKHCLERLVDRVDYEMQLDTLMESLSQATDAAEAARIAAEAQNNKSQHAGSTTANITESIVDHDPVTFVPDDNLLIETNATGKRINSTIKTPTCKREISHDADDSLNCSIDQFSLIDFHRTVLGNAKRSSLKRPFNFTSHPQPQDSPSLFTTKILPIRCETERLNSTSKLQASGSPFVSRLANADQLLDSMVSKNLERELEEVKEKLADAVQHAKELEDERKQFQVMLDYKREEVEKLRIENQRIHKEINKKIKEEGPSIKNSTTLRMTNLYNSVLNHTSMMSVMTPCKPLSQFESARKKRALEDDSQPTSDARYLDMVKNTEKSPSTERKTTKKKRTVETKQKVVKEEIKIIKSKIIEEDNKEEQMDDLAFLVEETTKKSKRSRPKKEVTTSIRKKIPLVECRESFIYENDDLTFSPEASTKKKRVLRSRKKIEYK